jgi:uncharacterized protein YdeI (YjbR/CyaY-like superfamily)
VGYLDNQKEDLGIPLELEDELRKNPKAQGIFWSLSPSHKKEYIDWVDEAKTEEKRQSRAQKAIEKILTKIN